MSFSSGTVVSLSAPSSPKIRMAADIAGAAGITTPQISTKRTVSSGAYPRGTPLTPPSPVLSVSQLAMPPKRSDGTIPIFFGSDSGSESSSDDELMHGSVPRLQDEESPSAAARRRSEAALVARRLKQRQRASDATALSNAPTIGGRSVNSFGMPRVFEKELPDPPTEYTSSRASVQTTSSSFIRQHPSSPSSIASTITVDSSPNNILPLSPITISSKNSPGNLIQSLLAGSDKIEKALDDIITTPHPPSTQQSFLAIAEQSASSSNLNATAQTLTDGNLSIAVPSSSSFTISAYARVEVTPLPIQILTTTPDTSPSSDTDISSAKSLPPNLPIQSHAEKVSNFVA